jgi:hypothetical protein
MIAEGWSLSINPFQKEFRQDVPLDKAEAFGSTRTTASPG